MNLSELIEAYEFGELHRPLVIHHDEVTADNDSGVRVFDMPKAELLEQLLDRAGIPHESGR